MTWGCPQSGHEHQRGDWREGPCSQRCDSRPVAQGGEVVTLVRHMTFHHGCQRNLHCAVSDYGPSGLVQPGQNYFLHDEQGGRCDWNGHESANDSEYHSAQHYRDDRHY